VQDELQELLRRRRKVKNEAPDNSRSSAPIRWTRLWDQIRSVCSADALALCGGLLVGGVV